MFSDSLKLKIIFYRAGEVQVSEGENCSWLGEGREHHTGKLP